MKKWEEMAQLIMEVDDKVDELHNALDDLYDLREKASDKLFDYEDYFLQDYPLNIIEKIMKLSCVKEKFINAPKTSNVFEKIPDDSL